MMTASDPPARQPEAVAISISMPRSSASPHSGISASGMIDSFTPQVSEETGVIIGI